jgi:hypothetical protein
MSIYPRDGLGGVFIVLHTEVPTDVNIPKNRSYD